MALEAKDVFLNHRDSVLMWSQNCPFTYLGISVPKQAILHSGVLFIISYVKNYVHFIMFFIKC